MNAYHPAERRAAGLPNSCRMSTDSGERSANRRENQARREYRPRRAGVEPAGGGDDYAECRTAATWGDKPPPRRMRLREWRAQRKNTLWGFCTIELPNGLIIRDISIREKNNKWWASLPSRPMLDADGRQITNHSGHRQYAQLLGWRDRDRADRFSAAVVELVRSEHPSDLDKGGMA
jgi:DNA-binding cell septation regulator SpoVG